MKNKRIVFMGTPMFAATVLKGLIENGYNVVGVVTQTDKKIGRKQILTYTPVKEVALQHDIEVFQPIKIRVDYQWVLDKKPDLIITSAYGQFIPKQLLDCPSFGCINTHASLLPKYRGGAPIQRSIINGDEKTGVSIIYMTEKMDEGDVLKVEELPIDIADTNATLFEKLSFVARNMLLEFLPDFFAGNINPVPQNHSEATYAWNLKKDEEFISFREPVKNTYDHIRGLLDNPGAYCVLENKKYKLIEVGFEYSKNNENPGVFVGLKDNCLKISCPDGFILVHRIQPEGKNAMDSKSFFNGQGRNLVGKTFNEVISNG